MFSDTITSIATAPLESAISIIRVSGNEAISIVNKLFSRDISQVDSHTIHYGFIIDPMTKDKVDEVLVSVFRAPKTFTVEDVVEINCHGGIYITNVILELLLKNGCRLALAGEFTRRAYLNGRIDLAQVEAIQDIIQANNAHASHLAINGLTGRVSQLINQYKSQLLDIIAHIEVNIDYPEYDDIEQLTTENLIPLTSTFKQELETIISKARAGKIIKNGLNTAIIGKPNVGKSSLLNVLLDEQKAIVTNIAGTTRDIVEGQVNIGGIVLNLIDTAGIRETEDIVEAIGVEKSKQMIEQAELVLLVIDSSSELDEQDQLLLEITKHKPRIIVLNKTDLERRVNLEGIEISALNNNIDQLEQTIEQRFNLGDIIKSDEVVIASARILAQLEKALVHLNDALQAMHQGMFVDLIVVDLESAYYALQEILGEVSSENLLDEMFSRFCLGK